MKKTIAYFHSTATASSGRKINGIYRAAAERDLNILRFDIRSPRQISETLAYWKPDGCIIEAGADNVRIPFEAFARIPHLSLDANPILSGRNKSYIVQDADAIAECAAEELSQRPLRTYAYAAWPERQFWSTLRGRAFHAAMSRRDIPVSDFLPHAKNLSLASIREALVTWLGTLDLPVGIFTATDSLSVLVLDAASKCGLNVPDDVMIIGVDNEEFTCETAHPTLSSVDPGFEYAGRQAVEALDRIMEARKRPVIVEKFKAPSLFRRSSTRLSTFHDTTVTTALDFIRAHATEGIGASDVLALFSCSRCLAERRFRAAAGRSILDEIHAVQVETAKKLLRQPFQKLETIPHRCGYASMPFFQKLFKRTTGCTMSEWRNQN